MNRHKLVIYLLTLIILLTAFDYGFADLHILTINLILSLLLVLTWFNLASKKGKITFGINPITVTLCLFFLICIFSLTYSIHRYSSLTEIMRVFTYLAVFFVSANFLSEEDFRRIFSVIAVWMGILAIHGLLEYLIMKETGSQEAKAVFAYHGTFATYLLLTFPVAFSLKRYNAVFLWLGGLGLLALIVSQSRSAWVSVIISSLFFAPLAIRRSRRRIDETQKAFRKKVHPYNKTILTIIIAVILLFIFDCFFMKSALIKRVETLFSPANITSAQARTKYWNSAGEITKDYLPTGTGIQTFYLIYPFFKDPSFGRSTHYFAHNDYLQILSELGPSGLIVFLSIVSVYLLTLRSSIQKGEKNVSLLLAIYFSSLAFFINCIFEFNIYIPSLMIVLYLYLAFVSTGEGKLVTISLKRYSTIYATIILLIILASFPYTAQIFLKRGDAAVNRGNVSVAILNYRAGSFFSPLNYLPHKKLATIYLKERRLREALKEAVSAVRLNTFNRGNHQLLRAIEEASSYE